MSSALTPSDIMNALADVAHGQVVSTELQCVLIDNGYVVRRAGPVPEVTDHGQNVLRDWQAAQIDVAGARKRADKTLMRE